MFELKEKCFENSPVFLDFIVITYFNRIISRRVHIYKNEVKKHKK